MRNLIKNPFVLCAITGMLTQFSLAPVHLYFFSIFSLIPWMYCLHQSKGIKKDLFYGLITGFFANFFGFYWMILVFQNYFNYTFYESINIYLLYCFLGQLQFFLSAGIIGKIIRDNNVSVIKKIVLSTIVFVVIDYFTPKLFGDTLGYSFSEVLPINRLARIGGVHLLSLFCVFLNFVLFFGILNKDSRYLKFCLIFILLVGTASELVASVYYQDYNENINVLVVQPNIDGKDKVLSEKEKEGEKIREKIIDKIFTLIKKETDYNDKIDLVVLPETAFPQSKNIDFNQENKIFNLLKSKKIPVLFGANDFEDERKYNSAFLVQWKDNSPIIQKYHKTILAFMGEYNPFSPNKSGSLNFGTGPVVFDLDTRIRKIKISPIICYEALSRDYLYQIKEMGAEVVFHLSNEAWFGYFGLPHSFLAFSSFRAVETGIPVLKVANSGFSALINTNGVIVNKSNLNKEESFIVKVPIK